ncbi:MAG: hypothetical protein R2939_12675 [Kofleriaceae bacterium]
MLVTFVDVTRRLKGRGRAGRGLTALLRSVIDSSPNLIMSTDRDGVVVSLSRLPPGRAADEISARRGPTSPRSTSAAPPTPRA